MYRFSTSRETQIILDQKTATTLDTPAIRETAITFSSIIALVINLTNV